MTITPQDRTNGSSKKVIQTPSEFKLPPITSVNEACPFIGLEDDAGTRLLYASPAAFCHRAEPTEAVDLTHQQAYCLVSSHKRCPVFMRPEWDILPAALAYHEPVMASSKKRWLWLVSGLVLLGLMVGSLFVWGNGRFPTPVESNPEAAMPIVVVAPTKTPTLTPTVVQSPTTLPTKMAVASTTPIPTNTATPQPTATLKPAATLVPTFTPILPTETAVPLLKAVVVVPNLNVRSGPGIAYELLGTIAEGQQVELMGRISDGSWWLICCVNGEPGWVIGEAIEIPEGAETIVPRVAGIPSPPTPTLQP